MNQKLKNTPSFGANLRQLRMEHGYTQEQLADRAECSWSFLSQLEANNGDRIHAPSLYTLFCIARALEISVSKLFEE